jgi:glucokinase
MSVIIAVDIGGTQLRVATFSAGSTIPLKIERTSTHNNDEDVFDRLIAVIDAVWPDDTVSAISTACPGPLDPSQGIIISTPNIPGWINFPLGDLLEKRYRVPVFLENDANLAALGEWRYGAGQGHNDVLYLTISTGIGGGVITGGRLLTGYRGLAAELGHLTVLPRGPRCSCGQRGHLEAIASGPAIARYVTKRVAAGRKSSLSGCPRINARDISTAARQGDELSLEALAFAGKYLGRAVADYLHIFNPSILIFGGGVSQSGTLLFDPMEKAMREHVMDPAYLDGLQITTARLGDDAGLLGALAQANLKITQVSQPNN